MKELNKPQRKTKFAVTFPDGNSKQTEGVDCFCRENNLDQKKVREVLNGSRPSWHGFKFRRLGAPNVPYQKRKLLLIHPNGKEEVIWGFRVACRKYKLNEAGIRRAATCQGTHHGFKVKILA